MKIGSYPEQDVQFLLTLIDQFMEETTDEREKKIQSSKNYFEMLPVEKPPTDEYMMYFYQSLEKYKRKVAVAVGVCCARIFQNKGSAVVLASLVRGGTPLGILMKRYFNYRYQFDPVHYGVSILRGKGIDEAAISYILSKHDASSIQFVDGWTGKGAIKLELDEAIARFNKTHSVSISPDLAVVSDPGYCTEIFGTREDFIIPSACLNATVSGLLSRTLWNEQVIGKNEFHGVKYYEAFESIDVSNVFVEAIVNLFPEVQSEVDQVLNSDVDLTATWQGLAEIKQIQMEFGLPSINLAKPGIGETTRILLRRVPWKILVRELDHEDLAHIYLLAKEKGVPIEKYDQMTYLCCGLIKPLVQS